MCFSREVCKPRKWLDLSGLVDQALPWERRRAAEPARSAKTRLQHARSQWVRMPGVRTHAPLKGDCDQSFHAMTATPAVVSPNPCAAERRLRRTDDPDQ